MQGTRSRGRWYVRSASLCAKILLSVAAALWSNSAAAQFEHGSGFGYDFHNAIPDLPDDRVKGGDKIVLMTAPDDEACLLSPLTGIRPPTTGVAALRVPGKARKEFQSACRHASRGKMAKAEDSLHKALQDDPQYAAAWVLLGQVLNSEQKSDGARTACSQALLVDPGYVAADLCLAQLAALAQKWSEVLAHAESAVSLDPAADPQACFYLAGAYLGLRRFAEAEKNALQGLELDKGNREPRTHFLLAQIYEIQRKPAAEAAQLQQYLKFATDPGQAAMVRKVLADLAVVQP